MYAMIIFTGISMDFLQSAKPICTINWGNVLIFITCSPASLCFPRVSKAFVNRKLFSSYLHELPCPQTVSFSSTCPIENKNKINLWLDFYLLPATSLNKIYIIVVLNHSREQREALARILQILTMITRRFLQYRLCFWKMNTANNALYTLMGQGESMRSQGHTIVQ